MTAGRHRFRGIRHQSAWDASGDIPDSRTKPHRRLLADPRFREGFACLGDFNLTFDAWMYAPQLADLADLANAFPRTTMVLDHVGTPIGTGPYAGLRDDMFAEWKDSIAAVAACPNVVVKLGGLAMPICGFGWETHAVPPTSRQLADATAHYYLHCIEQFGADRCPISFSITDRDDTLTPPPFEGKIIQLRAFSITL